jgi:hypothetical protein
LKLVLVLLFLLPLGALAQVAPPDFTFILLPDTQNEAQFYPNVLDSETAWVVKNRTALNIQAVLGLGDIVNDGASTAQQTNADATIKTLDNAGVPYLLAIGNHDYDGANTGAATRTATGFNHWFGPTRYAGKSYYKGNFGGSNEDFYGVLNINGTPMLILVLEYVPRTASLNWAGGIVASNPDKEVIVVTHSNMFWDSTRVDSCDTNDMPNDNDGDETWENFISQYPNIIMVVSGHITTGQTGTRSDIGANGNLVNQMLSDYQTLANGGDGWLRILTFHPATNSISVKTYSPYLNAYKTDSANQFTLYYHNPNLNTGKGTISGLVRQPRSSSSSSCQRLSGINVSAGGVSTTTDANGHYSLTLPPGQSYTVTASGTNWKTATQSAFVNDGFGADTNFFLTSASCTLSTTSPSVTICSPTASSTLSSPVSIIGGATDLKTVQFMQIYVDGVKKYQVSGKQVYTSLAMAAGAHRVTVQAYDGTYFHSTVNITVTAGGVSTTISPISASVQVSQTQQFTATVNGNSNTSVAWSVDGFAGGNSTTGTVSTAGLYTAPGTAGSHSVTATSVADTTKSAAAAVTVTTAPAVSVAISPTSASVQVNLTQHFTATVTGNSNISVTWSVDGIAGGNTTVGTVSTSGLYTAPSATGSHTVTATSVADTTKNAFAAVTVTASSSCTPSTVSPSVTICTPAPNATVSSPVSIVAGTTDSKTVTLMQIYLDGVKTYEVKSNKLNTSLAMTSSAHRLTVQAYDGTYFKTTENITVK